MDMQNTTTEPLNEEEATKQQQKLAELRRYNREYDHAHKKASECEHCKKVFSSVSALRRHQVEKKTQVQTAASDGDHREVHAERINNRYCLLGVIPPLPDHIRCYKRIIS
jgi:hypothetical protein